MADMVSRYTELRDEAATVGQEILDRYREDEDLAREAAIDATRYGMEKTRELEALVGQPDHVAATTSTAAQLYGCDITDRVRSVPFEAVPAEDRDEFFWTCAIGDNRQFNDFGYQGDMFAQQYDQAQELYEEFGTLVSREEWKRFLREEPWGYEGVVFTALREKGVGDRLPPDG